ncbi:thiosulfate:glutathione sulfurtransferase-like [Betta splendens]|uniref:Thiosulfate:glutathione sulfurtransferase-like n=1 Tax=Betta splendens TaxID=158456 RepID=A0A6P7NPU2_BETSP|nr:thiosulfate:glutathione sulfurtransferase-like [Betta splendens]
MASTVPLDISYADLKALLEKNQGVFLVDVRSKEEVDRGRIPGSINIPLDTVEAALKMDPADFTHKYGISKPPLDAPHLVFHCQMGRRGAVARDKARQLGYVSAQNYPGAYSEWAAKTKK